jgi:hypothetical protein
MITRPVRERSLAGIGAMVDRSVQATGFDEVGLLSLSSADHTEIAEITKGLADRYEGTNTSLSLPSTRVDAFNIDLANEISRNGRRPPHVRPEGAVGADAPGDQQDGVGGDHPHRQAFGQGWRQVKLYLCAACPRRRTTTSSDRRHGSQRDQGGGRRPAATTSAARFVGGFVPNRTRRANQWAAHGIPDASPAGGAAWRQRRQKLAATWGCATTTGSPR